MDDIEKWLELDGEVSEPDPEPATVLLDLASLLSGLVTNTVPCVCGSSWTTWRTRTA